MNLLKDHPASDEFALHIGKLIQNFGVVEMSTYRWIAQLSGSKIAVEISMELPLAKRIEVILNLLEKGHSSFDAAQRERATNLWGQLRDKGCELRNAVAHGATILAFSGAETSGNPVTSGVMKVRKKSSTDQMLGIDEIKAAVNTTAQIAMELSKIIQAAQQVGTDNDRAAPDRV
ncbi:MAG: hypothetical protein JNL39_14615 [Opitutaceae bacterium]|nr:hypothetical protein [Opitutaceae bacterium]